MALGTILSMITHRWPYTAGITPVVIGWCATLLAIDHRSRLSAARGEGKPRANLLGAMLSELRFGWLFPALPLVSIVLGAHYRISGGFAIPIGLGSGFYSVRLFRT